MWYFNVKWRKFLIVYNVCFGGRIVLVVISFFMSDIVINIILIVSLSFFMVFWLRNELMFK